MSIGPLVDIYPTNNLTEYYYTDGTPASISLGSNASATIGPIRTFGAKAIVIRFAFEYPGGSTPYDYPKIGVGLRYFDTKIDSATQYALHALRAAYPGASANYNPGGVLEGVAQQEAYITGVRMISVSPTTAGQINTAPVWNTLHLDLMHWGMDQRISLEFSNATNVNISTIRVQVAWSQEVFPTVPKEVAPYYSSVNSGSWTGVSGSGGVTFHAGNWESCIHGSALLILAKNISANWTPNTTAGHRDIAVFSVYWKTAQFNTAYPQSDLYYVRTEEGNAQTADIQSDFTYYCIPTKGEYFKIDMYGGPNGHQGTNAGFLDCYVIPSPQAGYFYQNALERRTTIRHPWLSVITGFNHSINDAAIHRLARLEPGFTYGLRIVPTVDGNTVVGHYALYPQGLAASPVNQQSCIITGNDSEHPLCVQPYYSSISACLMTELSIIKDTTFTNDFTAYIYSMNGGRLWVPSS